MNKPISLKERKVPNSLGMMLPRAPLIEGISEGKLTRMVVMFHDDAERADLAKMMAENPKDALYIIPMLSDDLDWVRARAIEMCRRLIGSNSWSPELMLGLQAMIYDDLVPIRTQAVLAMGRILDAETYRAQTAYALMLAFFDDDSSVREAAGQAAAGISRTMEPEAAARIRLRAAFKITSSMQFAAAAEQNGKGYEYFVRDSSEFLDFVRDPKNREGEP